LYIRELYSGYSVAHIKTLEELKNTLPWSEILPEELKITSSNKK